MNRFGFGGWVIRGNGLWGDGFVGRAAGEPDAIFVRSLLERAAASSVRSAAAGPPAPTDAEVWLLPLNSAALMPVAVTDGPPVAIGFVQPGGGPPRSILAPDPLAAGLAGAIDMDSKTVLGEGQADSIGLGEGRDDVLVIGGSGAVALAGAGDVYERIVLLGGSSYEVTAADLNVGAGRTVFVEAGALGAQDSLAFDGSAEKDGSFFFLGGAGRDHLTGGGRADTIYGLGGGDVLRGGGGGDIFGYTRASESTGAGYDTLADFNFAEDRIDLPVAVGSLAAPVTQGALSTASFDSNLAAALTGHLGAGQALLFTADSGDLASKAFLIVDGNGVAGYQAGADFVFHLAAPPPADLGGTGFLV